MVVWHSPWTAVAYMGIPLIERMRVDSVHQPSTYTSSTSEEVCEIIWLTSWSVFSGSHSTCCVDPLLQVIVPRLTRRAPLTEFVNLVGWWSEQCASLILSSRVESSRVESSRHLVACIPRWHHRWFVLLAFYSGGVGIFLPSLFGIDFGRSVVARHSFRFRRERFLSALHSIRLLISIVCIWIKKLRNLKVSFTPCHLVYFHFKYFIKCFLLCHRGYYCL